jgi:hypothetical protein
MPRLSLGLGVSSSSKLPSGGAAPITTSRAFNSSGVQVGSTNTGDIPDNWVANQTTVTSVIFANNNSVTSIGVYAFGGCTSLASITIPNSVTSIGDSAFQGCTSLATATIDNSVTSIGNYAFQGCTSLTSITIPSGVTSIGSYAFSDCNNLTSATIGTGVTSIGNYVFVYSSNLTTVLCNVAQSAFTGSGAFAYTASPLTIRARSTDASWTAGTGLSFQGNENVTVIKNL